MQIQHATLETCHLATGIVVVIDVIRAFTTAAYAFAAGAVDIIPVATVDEAFQLRHQFPGSLVMGEVNGFPPTGFDFGNSPAELARENLFGRRLIQRTSAGTQGIALSVNARLLLASSFVCAGATARFIQQQPADNITLVSTGDAGEDQSCAEYLEALLRGKMPVAKDYLGRVREAGLQRIENAPVHVTEAMISAFSADLNHCMDIDRFDFAMQVRRRGGLPILGPVPSDPIMGI